MSSLGYRLISMFFVVEIPLRNLATYFSGIALKFDANMLGDA